MFDKLTRTEMRKILTAIIVLSLLSSCSKDNYALTDNENANNAAIVTFITPNSTASSSLIVMSNNVKSETKKENFTGENIIEKDLKKDDEIFATISTKDNNTAGMKIKISIDGKVVKESSEIKQFGEYKTIDLSYKN